jgi:hypothetical protein
MPDMNPIPLVKHTLMLAGSGIVRAGAAAALRRFADVFGLAVANTWGAKGLFEWKSEHHMGTVGLQADDFRLLGFAEADLLLATGVDPDELPRKHWALAPRILELAPEALAALADTWTRPRAVIRPNDFLSRMSAAVQPLFAETKVPLSPARAVADYRAVLDGRDLLAADPGPAGLWVARTFPTTVLGSISVATRFTPGIAAQSALAAAKLGRRAIAVTRGPLDEATGRLLAEARRLGLRLVLDVWSEDPIAGARDVQELAQHEAFLRAGLAAQAVTLLRTPVDLRDTQKLIAVAGPVVAWPEVEIPFAGRD